MRALRVTDFRPTFFDRALIAIAPMRGLRRLQARVAADYALRSFDAAKFDRRLGSWTATGASANAELTGATDRLRFRARDLERNNRYVFTAATQFAGKVVGTGITPRPIHSSDRLRKKAKDAWDRFCDTCDPDGQLDYYGIQSLTARTLFRDGEILHVWRSRNGLPNSQISTLEVDHLDAGRSLMSGSKSVLGIEFDDFGARTGYHLFPVHPGETGWQPTRGSSKLISAEYVDHYFHRTRPGQIRGVSWLAPSIVALRGNDDIDEAVRWRKRLEACIGVILETPENTGLAPVVGKQTKQTAGDGKPRIEEQVAPGMVLRMGPGEKALAFQPTASGDTVEYLRSQLYAFCATTGVSYHAITGDASQANYSSMRAAELAGNVILDTVQWLIMAPRVKTAWRRVMQREALLTGDSRFFDVKCALAMPVRPWVDPVKEITAKIYEIRAGLQSMPDALAERGVDWIDQLAEIEAFIKKLDAAGIVIETDARQTTRAGQIQATLVAGQSANNSN